MGEPLAPTITYPGLVGQILADRRKAIGLNQAALGAAVGLHQSAWSKVERGHASLSLEQLTLAARALGARPSDILGDADRAVDFAQAQGVRVEWTRPPDNALAAGLALVGAAAVAGIIAAALADQRKHR